MEVLEEVVETVDETLDTLERIPNVNLNGTTKGQQVLILTFTAAVSAAAGGFITYKAMQSKLRKHYEEIAENEIAEAKSFYGGVLAKGGEFADPVSAAEALIPEDERDTIRIKGDAGEASAAVEDYAAGVLPQSEKDRMLTAESLKVPYHEMYQGDITPEQADVIIEKDPNADPQVIMDRIKFPQTPAEADNFDMEKEYPLRSLESPYVITHDEFFQGDRGFETQEVTWFTGDSVLVDSTEETIDDVNTMVGVPNMARFGHGSKDENIVYIRNERFEIDFEVTLSEGTYTKDVLGLDP